MSRLPSLSALHAFMVAAEHSSLSGAARVLFITPSAVSKQIKNLEDQLEVPLFHRAANRLVLTQAGAQLAGTLNAAFALIEDGVTQARNERRKNVDLFILAPPTLATRWLSTRLHDFYTQHTHITLTIFTEMPNIPLDLEIRFAATCPQEGAQLLAMEQNILVCSNAIFSEEVAGMLERYPLLHILHGEQVLPLWAKWLKRYDENLVLKGQFKFSTQDQVIHAALHDLGLAIVDRQMVHDLLLSDQLRQIDPQIQTGPYGYWLIRHGKRNPDEVAALCNWLSDNYMVDCIR